MQSVPSTATAVLDLLQASPISADYVPICFLGKGAFGHVYKVERRLDKKFFALKILPKERGDGENSTVDIKKAQRRERLFRQEIDVLRSNKTDHLIRFEASFENGLAIFLVTEYCEGRDLKSYMQDSKIAQLDEIQTSVVMSAVLKGLYLLHTKRNIIHRDIKPGRDLCLTTGNILIRKKPESPGDLCEDEVCIGDFGLCVMLIPPFTNKAKVRCGTTLYNSPEQLEGCEYDYAVDMFSVSIMTATVLTGVHPFYRDKIHDMEGHKLANWSEVMSKPLSK